MSDGFIDEESEDQLDEAEVIEALVPDNYEVSSSDARRRLERLLAEKKLRDELEDLF